MRSLGQCRRKDSYQANATTQKVFFSFCFVVIKKCARVRWQGYSEPTWAWIASCEGVP